MSAVSHSCVRMWFLWLLVLEHHTQTQRKLQ